MANTKKSTSNKPARSGKTPGKKNSARTSAPKKPAEASVRPQSEFSPRLIGALVSAALFVLFTITLIKPDGALLRWCHQFLLGTIGRSAFYISVPALVGLFVILVSSPKRPVLLRSICLGVFILVCGIFSDFLTAQAPLPKGFAAVSALYQRGIEGAGAGVVCGGAAALLRWLFGNIFSCIVLAVSGIILLLSAMNLTIPSIIRAIENRPRPEPPKEEAPRPEPAQVVVNHIANHQIRAAQRRELRRQQQIDIPVEPDPAKGTTPRADAFMNELSSDPAAPLVPAEPVKPEPAAAPQPAAEESLFTPAGPMPELEIRHPEPEILQPEPAPQTEEAPVPTASQVEAAAEVTAKVTSRETAESAAQVAQEIAQGEAQEKPVYCYPPIDLLRRPPHASSDGTEEMRENSRRLNETLESFKIEAHISNVTRGPSVTRYEVELEKGVRLNKLTTCADDIALSLGASGVRIAAVPGKISVVGIEVPNRTVTTVSLREVVDSPEFKKAKSKSSFAVGKDIGGSCIVGNIAKLPHMLIAGTTGSGKSVCMNSIIISLLYKSGPEDVKLIMVDPKMVELGIYNGIPHLLIPVVTDPKKAAGSLQWAVMEMMRRYRAMSDAGVRDLESYNAIIDTQEEEGTHLPQIVVIIDELADLMLVAAKEVEESICRIAQMGRAAGIHLIIATQRPSADVITGLMKANIPSRIAFAVASAMESRIILDTQGAEKLVGKGDMLYAPIGCGKPKRVQGSWVSEEEVEAVANFIKTNYQTEYDQQVMEEIDKKAEQTGTKSSGTPEASQEELDGDEMLPAAVDVILETGQASVSMLQRRLKLGYARAARIVDEMEDKGIVGPFVGSKPRSILITREQWQAMKNGTPDEVPEPEEEPEFVPDEE